MKQGGDRGGRNWNRVVMGQGMNLSVDVKTHLIFNVSSSHPSTVVGVSCMKKE